ncbi:uncharacterized protein [Trachinotus anak]|uniref:uncharacterized protein isoform X2 n=1 Tax=Trachinotus anak TaxID=443729 RepID=UPI0039F1A83C
MDGVSMHITIQEGRCLPQLKRCTKCCKNFHCPFCRSTLFRPAKLSKVRTHLENHFNRAIFHQGYTVHRCGLDCRPQWHYHCIYCQSTLSRKPDFIKHLSFCKMAHPAPTSTVPAPTTTSRHPSTTISAPATLTAPTTPGGQMQRIHLEPFIHKTFPICQTVLNKKNVKRHIERKHTGKHKDITAASHLQSDCIDPENGVYTVHKSFHNDSIPLHVQNKVWGENQHVSCESTECQVNMELAWNSGLKANKCIHLKSITYCTSFASSPELQEQTLSEMVNSKWFGEDIKKICLGRQKLAKDNHIPLSGHSKTGTPQSKKYISIYEPTVSSYSKLGRVMVSYNTKSNSWFCPCSRTKRSCPHKYIAKWHLFQTHPELFSQVQRTEEEEYQSTVTSTGDKDSDDKADLGNIPYPPKDDQKMKAMVQYILKFKRLPAVLPEHFRLPSVKNQYPRHLIPEEMTCQHCPGKVPLSDPVLITHKAKILTNSCIVQDVSTYCKSCRQCGTQYRYQEWKDGLHNFNDQILLDLPLCVTIRNMLQVHTAVSRVVEYLELTTGVQFPSADTVLQAYLHFEALTDHDYQYSCVTCGDYPPVVIMDFLKKGAVHLSESDLTQPPEDFNGEVDMKHFWEALSMERIAQGFVKSQQNNPLAVPPTFHFWAPWIGKNTRHSNNVLNKEFEKVCSSKPAEVRVSEDQLREELNKQKVEVVRTLCQECGLDSTGSRTDLLMRLSKGTKSRQKYDKVFQKTWFASGGWAVIMCPCSIVYSIKYNIRAESPQDFTDLLLSWKHMPNIVIYDFASELATHMNLRDPERFPFKPFEGQLTAPTPDNITRAKEGKLKVSLSWLNHKKMVPDCDGHPVTGSAEHYALYDRFHDDNTKDGRNALRKVGLVPQLAGKVNSQVTEKLFARMKKNNYFLNMALPSTHLFLMRNIIHHYNIHKNKQ